MHSIRPRRAGSRALRFAPVSGEHSTALRIAVGYFRITGALTLLGGTIGLVAGVARGFAASAPLSFALGAAIIAAMGAGALWTARLLDRKRRLGGIVGIATVLAPVAEWMVGRGTVGGVLFALAGAAIMLSVWNELE